jgi:hypothetical protein
MAETLYPLTRSMSFLNTLKNQAQATAAEQQGNASLIARNTQLVERACKEALAYFHTLSQQLNVLRPPSAGRHVLDKQTVFRGLPQLNFRVDARRVEKGSKEQAVEVYDHVVIHWELHGGGELELNKDFPPDIEKLEPRLRQSGAKVDIEAQRDAGGGKLLNMRYRFPALFLASVRLVPRHEEGLVTFKLMNLEDFDTVWATLPAAEVSAARLDDLARWIVGQPHRFLDGAQHIRRVEP